MFTMGNTEAKKSISKMFDAANAMAILSIVSAHITIRSSEMLANLYAAIGSIGVVLLLIKAGYYFKSYPFAVLVKKKFVSVILPWAILGSLVFVVNTILTSGIFNIVDLLLWLVGYKTYLYFVIVLLLCFLLFYKNNTVTLISAIAINAISLVLTACGVMDPIIEALHITNYLNILNWIGFFAIGILLSRVNEEKLYSFIKSTRLIWIGISLAGTVFITLSGYRVGYFSSFGWLYEIISTLSILGLCTFGFMENKLLSGISSYGYAIYLLHMMFIGVLGKVYNQHIVLTAIANIIVCLFICFILYAGNYIATKIKLGKIYGTIIGLRKLS